MFSHSRNEASEFHKECLEAHNNYRSKHKVPALKLNKELCIYAQEWADVSELKGSEPISSELKWSDFEKF